MDDLADTAAPTIDSARFRQVLGHFCSGIVIVTGMDGDDAVGLTCQSFSSVSLDPPLILFCPANTSSSWPRIRNSGAFAVNILSAEQEDVCRLFATKGADKFRASDGRRAPPGRRSSAMCWRGWTAGSRSSTTPATTPSSSD